MSLTGELNPLYNDRSEVTAPKGIITFISIIPDTTGTCEGWGCNEKGHKRKFIWSEEAKSAGVVISSELHSVVYDKPYLCDGCVSRLTRGLVRTE